MGTNAQYAYIALDRAIQDANLKPEDYENNERCASILGQGGTSIPDVTESCGYVADQVRSARLGSFLRCIFRGMALIISSRPQARFGPIVWPRIYMEGRDTPAPYT